jgi:hypothetical protein
MELFKLIKTTEGQVQMFSTTKAHSKPKFRKTLQLQGYPGKASAKSNR